MNKNNVLVNSENISGNIGSCSVTSARYNVSLFRVEETAINSCTGEIISRAQMFDSVWIVPGIMLLILLTFWGVVILFKSTS